MPSLGADMETGTLVEWLKQPGDSVKRGDVVAVVETQKGAIEVEIFEDGTITRHLVQPGTKVPVGEPLAELDGEGAPASEKKAEAAPAPPPAPSSPAPVKDQTPQQPAPSAGTKGIKASPAARKLAEERGIELAEVKGTGPEGAVVFVDVERAIRHGLERPPAIRKAPNAQKPASAMSEMRKAIAAAMSRSKREIPHYYLSHAADISAPTDWLARLNAERAPAARVLMGALFVKATATALLDMPEFNGFFTGGEFRPSAAVHVGMAISLRGGGLIAPAVHDADRLSLDDIMAKLRDLTARARTGRLRGSEIADPTITVSSLGDRGVDALYGVIHPPQVALVGFGTPAARPWTDAAGEIAARPVMTLTLAADHRVSDGHRGALFLSKIAAKLQAPEGL